MKLQSKILFKTLKGNRIWLVIGLVIILLDFILFKYNSFLNKKNYYYALITYPAIKFNYLLNMIFTSQILLHIFIFYKFYNYELENSSYNFLIRIGGKKWYLSKLVMIIYLIIFRIIYTLLLYILFKNIINFNISYIIYPTTIYIFLYLFISFISVILKNDYLFQFCLIFISFIIINNYFNIYILILISTFLLLINYYYFNIKKYTNSI